MKEKSVLIGGGVFGLVAGFTLWTGIVKPENLLAGALLAVPSIFATHLVADTKATKRVNEADEKITKLESDLRLAANTQALLETANTEVLKLSKELNTVRSALKESQQLQQSLTTITSNLEACKGRIEELEAECETWEEEFSDRVAREAEARFQVAKRNEIERIFQEHDAITSQAMALFRQLQVWGEKVAHGHQSKREIIQSLAASYNQNLDELGQSVEQERGHYLTQIELLNFLPNLYSAKFDAEKNKTVITQANQLKRQFLAKTSGKNGSELVVEAQNACVEGIGKMAADPPFPTIGVSSHSSQSGQVPHCPHCGGSDLKVIENGKRHQCKSCTKRFVTSKAVWK